MISRTQIAKWVLILGAVMIPLAVTPAISKFHREIDRNRQLEIHLIHIEAQANLFHSMQWQALARSRVDSDFLQELHDARKELLVTVNQLKDRDQGSDPDLQMFYATYTQYVTVVDQEMLLIAVGRLQEARETDGKLVEPAFQGFQRAIAQASEAYSGRAQQSIRRNEQESMAAVIGSALAVLLLFWRFQVLQRSVRLDLMAAEQAALRRSEERFRALTENGSDLIVIADPEGVIRYASASVKKVLNYAKGSLDGKNLCDYVQPDEAQVFRALLRKLAEEPHESRSAEFRLRHAAGSWIHAEATGHNLLADPNIAGMVFNIRDISERKRGEEKLIHAAFHDALTTLPNRALFLDRLEHAISHMRRHPDYQFAVLFVDLDRFKLVNDSLGHNAGDELIIQCAGRLSGCIRRRSAFLPAPEAVPLRAPGDDTLARLGGDEFTVLLEDIKDPADALKVAERFQEELSLPFVLLGQEVFMSASIGIAFSGAYQSAEDLLRDADIAMYRAKAQGKARIVVFDSAMHQHTLQRLKLETELRRALEHGEFRLHYQPIVSLKTGKIAGFEALVRWEHPEMGLVSPAKFIPLAEETGLIIFMGRWILHEACRQTHEWHTQLTGSQPCTININISAKQFAQPDFVNQVRQTLQDTAIDPGTVELEITESTSMVDAERTTLVLEQLKELGVRITIDDFGTGYSSLSYLRRFPLDALKIDGSFVRHMQDDEENQEIVRTILNLGRSLGMDVIAECTEVPEQVATLKQMHCDFAQGYYFSPPVAQEDVPQLLEDFQPGLVPQRSGASKAK